MSIQNRNLEPGIRLVASYKKSRYTCTVEAGDEEGGLAYVLEDGSRHKSPSAAGSRVMGGKAVNGWRFWSVEGEQPAALEEKPEKPARRSKRPRKTISKAPNQQALAEGSSRWFCSGCMKSFIVDGNGVPQQCPEGHRNDDPELNAPSGVEEAAATA